MYIQKLTSEPVKITLFGKKVFVDVKHNKKSDLEIILDYPHDLELMTRVLKRDRGHKDTNTKKTWPREGRV